jgi:hypothetical protein
VTEDPTDPLADGRVWRELCSTLESASELVLGPGVPAAPTDRAEGFRHLLRFLSAGIDLCVEHGDPDHPEFTRMMDLRVRWGLDNPDCLYLFASVRGDAEYRVWGDPGSAAHLDLQVNAGHYASGAVEGVRTLGSLALQDMECEPDGTIEVTLGGAPRAKNWLPLAGDAQFVLLRQLFLDWRVERPANLVIERVGGPVTEPRIQSEAFVARVERLRVWLTDGARLWQNLSRVMLAIPANTLRVAAPERSREHSGTADQIYAMGNFACGPDDAVILEFRPPACRYWGVSLATWWWEAVGFATRQSSLNAHQAWLDRDGVFRAVIADRDPGVPNWLDTAGHERGTLIARFLLAESAPAPILRKVALRDVRAELPPDQPGVSPEAREAALADRRHAVWLRCRG